MCSLGPANDFNMYIEMAQACTITPMVDYGKYEVLVGSVDETLDVPEYIL